jgi:hypothetical protein
MKVKVGSVTSGEESQRVEPVTVTLLGPTFVTVPLVDWDPWYMGAVGTRPASTPLTVRASGVPGLLPFRIARTLRSSGASGAGGKVPVTTTAEKLGVSAVGTTTTKGEVPEGPNEKAGPPSSFTVIVNMGAERHGCTAVPNRVKVIAKEQRSFMLDILINRRGASKGVSAPSQAGRTHGVRGKTPIIGGCS